MMEIWFLHLNNIITNQTNNDWRVGSRRRGPEIKAVWKLNRVTTFSLRPVVHKKGGEKSSWSELCSTGIRVACVYLLITATLILCAEGLADHHSAGFSSLNTVGEYLHNSHSCLKVVSGCYRGSSSIISLISYQALNRCLMDQPRKGSSFPGMSHLTVLQH